MKTTNKRRKILIPFYYDEEFKTLYPSSEYGNPVRTQFFTDEQLKEMDRQIAEIETKKPPSQ